MKYTHNPGKRCQFFKHLRVGKISFKNRDPLGHFPRDCRKMRLSAWTFCPLTIVINELGCFSPPAWTGVFAWTSPHFVSFCLPIGRAFAVVILHLSYVYSRVLTTTSAEPWEVLSASLPAFLRILRQYFIIHLGHNIHFSIDSNPLCSRMASGTNLAAMRI